MANSEEARESDETKISELMNRMEALKMEKVELTKENKEIKERMNKLSEELMQNKIEGEEEEDEWEDDSSSFFETMKARSGELEREVRRLQHDVITSNGELEEAKSEVSELKKRLEEKALVVDRLRTEIGELRREKVKGEKKGRELETKIGILEIRVKDEMGIKVRVEQEMKAMMDDLNYKIQQYLHLFNHTNDQLRLSKQQKRESEDKVMGLELNLLALKDLVHHKTNQADIISRNIDSQRRDNDVFLLSLATGTLAAVVVVVAVVNRCCNKRIDG